MLFLENDIFLIIVIKKFLNNVVVYMLLCIFVINIELNIIFIVLSFGVS